MGGLFDRFSVIADRLGERTAIEVQRRDGLEAWSYGRLRTEAEALAARWAALGLGRGDRVALLSENDPRWCAAFLGLMRLGAVAVPFDTTYTPEQVGRLVADCEARMIVVSPRFGEVVERSGAGRSCAAFPLVDGAGASPPEVAALPDPGVGPNEIAAILYTSGTTSDPKGVVLTHGNLLAEIDAVFETFDIDERDAVLGVLPLFHALALLANLLLPLSAGARVVFLETVASAELLRALGDRGITVFCCVPQFFYLIHQRILATVARAGRLRRVAFHLLLQTAGVLRERLGVNVGPLLFRRVHRALGQKMRLLITGGSAFDARVGRDLFRLGFDVLQAYGLTETSGAATVLRRGDRHVASVGQALPGVEVKIVPSEVIGAGAAGDGATARGVGEVLIRGPLVTPGYFRREDATAAAVRGGWLHTGDLGYLDPAGRLYLTGRAKDVIVLGSGKNIHPEEIEAHYAQSPFIKELCVMGRAAAGEPMSERLHAIVVPDFEVLRERKIFNSRDVLRFEIESLSGQLPGHKRILSYEVVSAELPRTTTRKLKRFEIERRFGPSSAAGTAPPAAATGTAAEASWATDAHVRLVVEELRQAVRGRGVLGPSANLELDLGLDSMERVELLAALETRFGVTLPEEVVHGIHTVGELVEAFRAAGNVATGSGAAIADPWPGLLGNVAADDPVVAPILIRRPLVSLLLFATAKLVYVKAWLLLGLRVSGREHLPREGPFLISPNHQSFLDAFLLASVLPFRVFRHTFYVGATEYFTTRFRAWLARLLHVVPVDPDTNLLRAMKAGACGLRQGKVLILFPEGERSIDAAIKTFKKGAAILSLNVGAPIVPVALDGVFDIWPRTGWPRFSKLLPFSGARARIRFGPPLEPEGGERRGDEDYTRLTGRLRDRVAEMLAGLRAPKLEETR